MKPSVLLLAGVASLLAACGSSSEAPPAEQPETETAAIPPAPVASLSQSFVDTISASDMFETQAGQLAQQSGTSDAVKAFGARMVKDHEASTASLKAAATQNGLNLAPTLSPDQDAKLTALRNAGEGFDALYAQQQVAAHETALQALRDYAAKGDNAALKDFATKTAQTVERHLEDARKLPAG